MLNEYQRETLQEIIVMLGALLHENEIEDFRSKFQIVRTETKKELPKGMRLRPDGRIEYRFTLVGAVFLTYQFLIDEYGMFVFFESVSIFFI